MNPQPAPTPIADTPDPTREITDHREVYRGARFSMVREEVRLAPDADPIVREFMDHPGAVAVAVLRENAGQTEILMLRQYRHPVRAHLWEIPAGLLDVAGEDPLIAAQRELAEEAEVGARDWHVLTDWFTSPGASNESLRVYVARNPYDVAVDFVREDEEAEMEVTWVPLTEAVRAVYGGQVHNPNAVIAILAVWGARDFLALGDIMSDDAARIATVRDADAPWMR